MRLVRIKMQRQGLVVSVNELRKLADELKDQLIETSLELGLDDIDLDTKFEVGIINKTKCYDEWRLE